MERLLLLAVRISISHKQQSTEMIDVDDLLEYAPLSYQLPTLYFNQVLQMGRAIDKSAIDDPIGGADIASRKKPKIDNHEL